MRRKLFTWFSKQGRTLPWRTNPTPYAVLVSEFMLQQTQVATVIPYFERWMERFPDLETLAAAEEDAVLSVWQGLGYYSRARNLQAAARAIVEKHGGRIPSDPAQLRVLPGIGPYCAGAIAAFAFDLPVATVDANIARVLARLGNVQAAVDSPSGTKAVWALAESLLPERGGRAHTSALMELGALVCTPRKPQCLLCPVRGECAAEEPETLPRKAPRRQTVAVLERAAWMESEGTLLLERQTGKRAKGLWKLPALQEAEPAGEPLFSTVYGFTHHRVTLEVFTAPSPEVSLETARWFALERVLNEAALVAAHRRAIEALLAKQSMKTDAPQSIELT
jgi:A/G-specific adenine glycosylase